MRRPRPERPDDARALLWVSSHGDYQERGRYYWVASDDNTRRTLAVIVGDRETAAAALARIDLVQWGDRFERAGDGYLIDVVPPPELELRAEPVVDVPKGVQVTRDWCSVKSAHHDHPWQRTDETTGEVQRMHCPGVKVREAARAEY